MGNIHSFQFSAFLRALFLILSAAMYTALIGVPALVFSLFDHSGRWSSSFQKAWVYCLFCTNGIRFQVEGQENLKKGGAYTLIANHISLLDIPALVAAIPLPVRFIAKKSLAWFPIFGWFMYVAGHVLIDRESTLSAVKSLKKASRLMKSGISVIVFPEGTRSPDGEVKEFKRGAFLLTIQSKTPIVPVSISGTYEMLPRTGCCFWPGTIDLKIGTPIPTQNLSDRKDRPLMEKVRKLVIHQKRNPPIY